MSLYPTLETSADEKAPIQDETTLQALRLKTIKELESYLRSEIETRSRLHKKYRRAVNIASSTSAVCSMLGMGAGASGTALLATGIAFLPGVILEVVTGLVCLIDAAGIIINRKCLKKANKHEAVRILACSKLNTIHSHIIQALEDDKITSEEYKLIIDETEKYRAMKEEIRRKSAASPVVDEELKKQFIKQGQEEAMAKILKKLGST